MKWTSLKTKAKKRIKNISAFVGNTATNIKSRGLAGPVGVTFSLGFISFVAFQNFSAVPVNQLNPNTALPAGDYVMGNGVNYFYNGQGHTCSYAVPRTSAQLQKAVFLPAFPPQFTYDGNCGGATITLPGGTYVFPNGNAIKALGTGHYCNYGYPPLSADQIASATKILSLPSGNVSDGYCLNSSSTLPPGTYMLPNGSKFTQNSSGGSCFLSTPVPMAKMAAFPTPPSSFSAQISSKIGSYPFCTNNGGFLSAGNYILPSGVFYYAYGDNSTCTYVQKPTLAQLQGATAIPYLPSVMNSSRGYCNVGNTNAILPAGQYRLPNGVTFYANGQGGSCNYSVPFNSTALQTVVDLPSMPINNTPNGSNNGFCAGQGILPQGIYNNVNTGQYLFASGTGLYEVYNSVSQLTNDGGNLTQITAIPGIPAVNVAATFGGPLTLPPMPLFSKDWTAVQREIVVVKNAPTAISIGQKAGLIAYLEDGDNVNDTSFSAVLSDPVTNATVASINQQAYVTITYGKWPIAVGPPLLTFVCPFDNNFLHVGADQMFTGGTLIPDSVLTGGMTTLDVAITPRPASHDPQGIYNQGLLAAEADITAMSGLQFNNQQDDTLYEMGSLFSNVIDITCDNTMDEGGNTDMIQAGVYVAAHITIRCGIYNDVNSMKMAIEHEFFHAFGWPHTTTWDFMNYSCMKSSTPTAPCPAPAGAGQAIKDQISKTKFTIDFSQCQSTPSYNKQHCAIDPKSSDACLGGGGYNGPNPAPNPTPVAPCPTICGGNFIQTPAPDCACACADGAGQGCTDQGGLWDLTTCTCNTSTSSICYPPPACDWSHQTEQNCQCIEAGPPPPSGPDPEPPEPPDLCEYYDDC